MLNQLIIHDLVILNLVVDFHFVILLYIGFFFNGFGVGVSVVGVQFGPKTGDFVNFFVSGFREYVNPHENFGDLDRVVVLDEVLLFLDGVGVLPDVLFGLAYEEVGEVLRDLNCGGRVVDVLVLSPLEIILFGVELNPVKREVLHLDGADEGVAILIH